ncbi:hypothetical protein [Aromatoleum evansii]|uniref:hypothetical protein n=1 Tax=Aromatoleum evansii TaxID=59406 RepID=UPI00145F90DA|nr:hypothetical protein [Aromatoleum evansii]NMG29344.1 hypothetical protein [Aromatoleum evansii]
MTPLARYIGQFSGDFIGGLFMAIALLVSGLWAGFEIGAASSQIELAQVREAAARDQAAIAEHASRRLLDAQERGDALTTQLETANRAAMRLQENLDDAIRRATTGRPCLREPALRLLNGAHGINLGVPAPAGRADATDGTATAAAGELVSTDTDVALWIARAGRQYDECRRRLGTLIDWHGDAQ